MFIEYNQNQTYLLPQNFKEFLWEWHQALILSELVDELDLEDLLNEYTDESRWRPAYHPRMMLKVLFYWYMNQTFSSRKLANKLMSDLWFMFIAWNNKPDFRTINRFRKEKGKILENIFVQVVLKAKELWMIQFWTVSLDWTKIYANASKDKSYTIEKLETKIGKLFDEAERIDEIEDSLHGEGDWSDIPEELRTKKGRAKRKKEIEAKKDALQIKKEAVNKWIDRKEEQWIKQERINLTDQDSRLMMMKKKDWGVGYNPQNLTENQFILETTVPNSAEDTWELVPILDKFHKNYGELPDKQLADAGYASEENYQYMEDNKIESYVPHQKTSLNMDDYTYDEKNNSYQDKEGNTYKFKQNIRKKKWVKWRPKKWVKLKEEEIKAIQYITTLADWKNKIITVNKNWKALCKRNDERLYSEAGREKYKKRSGCVENVFWNIKMNFWFTRFLLRWFEWVEIERNLICLAHNFQKIIGYRAKQVA